MRLRELLGLSTEISEELGEGVAVGSDPTFPHQTEISIGEKQTVITYLVRIGAKDEQKEYEKGQYDGYLGIIRKVTISNDAFLKPSDETERSIREAVEDLSVEDVYLPLVQTVNESTIKLGPYFPNGEEGIIVLPLSKRENAHPPLEAGEA